ncbi:MAG: TIGR00282 family metallophosphoesterase [Gammaproteobacteria bacterium]|nr:TIGR00282 family metallophosphoesterase [Gammaproteobacteria bacterium]
MNVLMVGDVYARPGRRVLRETLGEIQSRYGIDFTVVNVENAAGGFGITEKVLEEFHALPIDAMTSGNHIWDKREALDFIDGNPDLLRPHNYPADTPGSGWYACDGPGGVRVGVLNLMGQIFMNPTLDSPFDLVDEVLENEAGGVDVLLVDFHAETTSEKVAMGWHLDGRVAAVVGTHTHIPTADERILPGGTAYITDLGMTGCYDSVIGSDRNAVLKRMVHKLHARLDPATGDASLCGVIVEVDESTGLSRNIQRIRVEAE